MAKTRKNGRGSTTRGWKNEKPGYHQRTVMMNRCGKKCFLGPGKVIQFVLKTLVK